MNGKGVDQNKRDMKIEKNIMDFTKKEPKAKFVDINSIILK